MHKLLDKGSILRNFLTQGTCRVFWRPRRKSISDWRSLLSWLKTLKAAVVDKTWPVMLKTLGKVRFGDATPLMLHKDLQSSFGPAN